VTAENAVARIVAHYNHGRAGGSAWITSLAKTTARESRNKSSWTKSRVWLFSALEGEDPEA
jgi:hypothetical protein